MAQAPASILKIRAESPQHARGSARGYLVNSMLAGVHWQAGTARYPVGVDYGTHRVIPADRRPSPAAGRQARGRHFFSSQKKM
jgi:hypothetical protein